MASAVNAKDGAAPSATAISLRRLKNFAFGVPLYAWLLVLVIVPMVLLFVNSFWISDDGVLVKTISLDNYLYVLQSATFRLLFFSTIGVSLAVGVLATCIAFPMAYVVSQRLKRGRLAAAMLVVIPLWVSLLIRVFAWKIILGRPRRPELRAAMAGGGRSPDRVPAVHDLHRVPDPDVRRGAVRVRGDVRGAGARAALPARSVGRPRRLAAAAVPDGDLASRSHPGVAIGFTLAFVLAVGDCASLAVPRRWPERHDGRVRVIVSEFGVANNWPLGAAMAIVLLTAVMIVTLVVARLGSTKGVLEGDMAGSGMVEDAVSTSRAARVVETKRALVHLSRPGLRVPVPATARHRRLLVQRFHCASAALERVHHSLVRRARRQQGARGGLAADAGGGLRLSGGCAGAGDGLRLAVHLWGGSGRLRSSRGCCPCRSCSPASSSGSRWRLCSARSASNSACRP